MRIFLCHPHANVNSIYPPLGLGVLAGELKRNGHEVEVRDGSAPYFPGNQLTLIHKILSFKPDLVGVAGFTDSIYEAYELAKSLRKTGFDGWLITGGPHVSMMHEEALSNGYDFVVLDEAEESFPDLVKTLEKNNDPYNIEGIAFQKDGSYQKNPLRSPIKDLDRFFPVDLECYKRTDYISTSTDNVNLYGLLISSRGCPGRCTFCARLHMGRRINQLKPETILNEMINRYERYNVRKFLIFDDMFFVNRKTIYQLCDLLDGRFSEKISIHARSRVDRGDIELLRRMKSVGFTILSYGVESANKEILRKAKKQISISQAKESIKNAVDEGFEVHVNMMMGFEWESVKSIKDNIEFVKYCGSLGVKSFPQGTTVWPFPGSEIGDTYIERLKEKNEIPWWLKRDVEPDRPGSAYSHVVSDIRLTKHSTDFFGVYKDPLVLKEAKRYLRLINDLDASRTNRAITNKLFWRIFVYCFRIIYAVSPKFENNIINVTARLWRKGKQVLGSRKTPKLTKE